MNNKKIHKQKRAFTLLELMIVLLLITMLGGILTRSMRGSVQEGRAFKSEQGSKQIYDLLTLTLADGKSIEEITKSYKDVIQTIGFVDNPKKLVKDGWNQEYQIIVNEKGDDFIVFSEKWYEFLKNKKHMTEEEMQEHYPWAFRFDENRTLSYTEIN